ncbi:lipopolysaccharide transport periplasmic protein LptA [Neisseria leonii]|uniref:lipopolysaccharide transport periplasmic protein LptA n=1 Tax=Neisseria leonii TaxID=2995413 RepID=UPI00237BD99C|nr:lipopolysaccharide transport periplasmic protein LptA [Neisseria sp. 3986]MDD9325928.1 lipopolysaccharide transport periplasmic protein LptA [Neisseria sp. 3986]
MYRKTLPELLLAALLLAAPAVWALESDRSRPIEIEADQGQLDQRNQSTTFSGNVIIRQGTLNIRAASVNVVTANNEQVMKALGSPVQFSQMLDNNKGTVNGRANRIDYTSADGMVVLSGNARVTRGGDSAEGDRITYNTRTEVYTVNSNPAAAEKSGRRVNVVIQPQKR